MGLGISVGILSGADNNDADRDEGLDPGWTAINYVLNASGLPAHAEPRSLPQLDSRSELDSCPYSFIHYLRRAYAHRRADPTWLATPLPEGEDPSQDEVLQAEYDYLSSHLICHSDAEGYYVPVDFEEVLFAKNEDIGLPGGMLGSSYRLMEELILVAPALGIQLNNGQLSDAEATRICEEAAQKASCYRELDSWIILFESARLSLTHKTAIVFC
ncbi:hypothetical protein [Undibacterium sp.]|uniref:hypothetical protein n=1 Tax=Undibacterium sp. TaxID=1914977 RepID=UPI002731C06F|nr:hypothetical protein [Undibacterium sp.]MDP1979129.1 hypothetical protein [Undibacterium sp.]